MDQLFPNAVDNVDVAALYASDERPARDGRPWVMANMISSIDGAVEVGGLSGGLGGPGDKVVFSAIRAVADIIVAASGTVIAENYRRPQTPKNVQELRVARGQEPLPRIAVVTNSLRIPADHRVFDPEARPLLITSHAAPADRVEALGEVADIVACGEVQVDLTEALGTLSEEYGAKTVLVEGGPTLNAAFAEADLLDEFCLSFSPMIAGGSGPRVVGPTGNSLGHPMDLARVLQQDSFLFHRYVRAQR